MEALPPEVLLLAMAAVLAGLVDAVVGGGGLIQVPMLFSVFPSAAPATLFGTNKLASVWGTAVAARSYAQRFPVAWNVALPASLAALVFAFVGAWAVSVFPPVLLRKALPFLLLLVAAYVSGAKRFWQRPPADRKRPPKNPLGDCRWRTDWLVRRVFWARDRQLSDFSLCPGVRL